ncbi:MAG: biopolymer transporter ExbD [Akkermansiaceae bacterium]|nr:biopolymer transporter ExbD [Akkermansiaceae bacterium]
MASSKLRRSSAGNEDECQLDMSPMIDMVFLLLIFFIVNATAIIVKTDPKVEPPVAKNAVAQTLKDGRIVVNVRPDGTYTAQEYDTILPDEGAIKDYVEKQKDMIESMALEPRLHLRGDQNAIFKHSRVAVRAAAEAGVNQVIFAVFNKPRK